MDVLVGFWDGVKEAFELGAEDPDSEGDMLGSIDGLSDKEGFIESSRLGSLDLDGEKLGTEDGSADTEGDELDSFVGLAVGGYVAAIGLVVGAAIGLVVGGYVAAIGDNVGGGLGGAAIGDNVGGRLGGDGLGAGAATE